MSYALGITISHECVELVEKLRAIICCFLILAFGVIPLSHAEENGLKMIARTKKTILIPDCDQQSAITKVVVSFFQNGLKTTNTYQRHNDEFFTVLSFIERKPNNQLSTNRVGYWRPAYLFDDLKAEALSSVSKTSFVLEPSGQLVFTNEAVMDNLQQESRRLSTVEAFRTTIGPTLYGFRNNYVVELVCTDGKLTVSNNRELPCIVEFNERKWLTYDIELASIMEKIMRGDGAESWITIALKERWTKKLQSFWQKLIQGNHEST